MIQCLAWIALHLVALSAAGAAGAGSLLCLWEVWGGQSLAQNTKGELGGLLVEEWH